MKNSIRDDDADGAFAQVCQRVGDRDLAELARASGLGTAAAEAVATIDAVMQRIRRNILRRDFGRRMLAELDPSLEVGHLDAIGAIAKSSVPSEGPDEEVTVGVVAERLAIDPSRASRLVAELVERSYVRRLASQADARRIGLELTDRGQGFIDAVRRNKWEAFSRALGQWDEADLVTFARLFERFSTWTTDQNGVGPRGMAAAPVTPQGQA